MIQKCGFINPLQKMVLEVKQRYNKIITGQPNPTLPIPQTGSGI